MGMLQAIKKGAKEQLMGRADQLQGNAQLQRYCLTPQQN